MSSTTTFPDWVKTSSCTCTAATTKIGFFAWSVDREYTSQVYGDKTLLLSEKNQVMCTGPEQADAQNSTVTHLSLPAVVCSSISRGIGI